MGGRERKGGFGGLVGEEGGDEMAIATAAEAEADGAKLEGGGKCFRTRSEARLEYCLNWRTGWASRLWLSQRCNVRKDQHGSVASPLAQRLSVERRQETGRDR